MVVAVTAAAVLLLTIGFGNPAVGPYHATAFGGGPPGWRTPGTGLPGHLPNDHIKHVITIMMENHDYDSYFATYCQTRGPYCSMTGNGIPAGTCIPYYPSDPSLGCIVPYNFTPAQLTISDMEHDWYSGGIARDGGAMDAFYQAEGTTNAFGHYNQTTIPIFWDMAEEYAMSDNFWGGNLSWSLPNHWYLLAGQTPPTVYDSYISEPFTYLNEANRTRTIQDLLSPTPVTWKYYYYNLSSYNTAISSGGIWDTAYDYWNPLAARAESYNASFAHHFVPRQHLLYDLRHGTLPNVSWVMPDPAYSSHPGWNESNGETWIAQVVNALENSTDWNSTALFITWDDFGGFYEHVAPRMLFGDRLSFRAPILVISPYAKENYISHSPTNFMSLLRFVEWQFGLGCLTPTDCLATLPLDFFNFDQTPRAPILFGTMWNSTTYPMPLQGAKPIALSCSACLAVSALGWAPSNLTREEASGIPFD